MVYEFALEPELVATWHDRKEYLFFEEKFGLRTGGIVSSYPRKMEKTCLERLLKRAARKIMKNAENEGYECFMKRPHTNNCNQGVTTFEEITINGWNGRGS